MIQKFPIKTVFGIVVIMLSVVCVPRAESGLEGRQQIELSGKTARIGVDLAGGSIVDFHLIDQEVNPLNWNYPETGDVTPRSMGHFICFDRLGQPSPQERKNGMPFHGESAHVEWQVISEPEKKEGAIVAEMYCELPLAGMSVTRTLRLSENTSVLYVSEEFKNLNRLGRVCNIVQHPTIAAPFLDESVCVDSNAFRGFWTGNPMPYPEEPVVYWPDIIFKDMFVDLRRLYDSHDPGVVSFVTADDEEYGWITACNPAKGLMIGYIWKTSDYPWLRMWRNARNGKPFARGLEFGTTPLPVPFGNIVAKGTIFNCPVYEYLDSEQSIVKSYVAFLTKIPLDYMGVKSIDYKDSEIIIIERQTERKISITLHMK